MSLGERDWVAASFCLPRDEHMPVLVRLIGGKVVKQKTCERDWRDVVAWKRYKKDETP